MQEKRLTRAYEGRVPAKAMIEDGALWVPVAHHIDGVFENRDTYTTITFERAEGDLAEETLTLAEEYRTLRERIEQPPHPGTFFTLEEIPTLPPDLDEPRERGGWLIYPARDATYASHSDVTAGTTRIAYYRLTPHEAGESRDQALERFERAIVEHGRCHIRLKEVNARMRENANTLRARMQ